MIDRDRLSDFPFLAPHLVKSYDVASSILQNHNQYLSTMDSFIRVIDHCLLEYRYELPQNETKIRRVVDVQRESEDTALSERVCLPFENQCD